MKHQGPGTHLRFLEPKPYLIFDQAASLAISKTESLRRASL